MSRTDPQFNLRIPESLRDKVMAAAKENKRSATAEILARLDESFEHEVKGAALAERLQSAKRHRPAGQSEAAALLAQGIKELQDKMTEFQYLVENLPASDVETLVMEEPELYLNPRLISDDPSARRMNIRRKKS